MFKNFKIFPWGLSLWFSWILITIGYVISGSTDLDNVTAWSGSTILGMFTPLGLWSFLSGIFGGLWFGVTHWGIESFALSVVSRLVLVSIMFFALSYGEKLAQHLGFDASKPISKLLFNLAILFCLTFVVDMFIYGRWFSLYLLIGLKLPIKI